MLPGHAAFLTTLGTGEVMYRAGRDEHYLAVSGGFAEVRNDKVIILADTAERPEEIDRGRAERARERAERRLSGRGVEEAVDYARATAALDGETALALAETHRPDLVLLDVNLPDMSGLEVCAQLRRDPRLASMKIVMLTAAAQADDVTRGLAAGADHYLTKPFSPVRLLGLIETLLPCTIVWQRG